jgi:allantoicase
VLNNPVALRLLGARAADGSLPDDGAWVELVARTPVKSLAGASLVLGADALAAAGPFTHVRLETFPDGGANRLRVFARAI